MRFRQEAVQIYYIPWPAKKLLPKICTQTRLPKTAKICAACKANWPMLPKNELQKNILYLFLTSFHRYLLSIRIQSIIYISVGLVKQLVKVRCSLIFNSGCFLPLKIKIFCNWILKMEPGQIIKCLHVKTSL